MKALIMALSLVLLACQQPIAESERCAPSIIIDGHSVHLSEVEDTDNPYAYGCQCHYAERGDDGVLRDKDISCKGAKAQPR